MNVLFVDSGIGGISTLATTIKHIPNLNFIYFADNKFSPYGSKSPSQITNRLLQIISQLADENIGLIVLACNTATAAAVDNLRKLIKIPIIGTEPAINLAPKTSPVLLLATPVTTKHARIQNLIEKHQGKVSVLPLPHFAKAIDKFYLFNSKKALFCIKKTIKTIKMAAKQSSHIILGCTHYIFLAEIISKQTKKTVLDGNFGVYKQVLAHIKPEMISNCSIQKFILSKQKHDLCKKYRKIFDQTLANVSNVW